MFHLHAGKFCFSPLLVTQTQVIQVEKGLLISDNLILYRVQPKKKIIVLSTLTQMTSMLYEISNNIELYSYTLILLEKPSNSWDLRQIIYHHYNFLYLPFWCCNEEVITVWPFSLWQIEFSMTWWCDKVTA